MRVLIIGGTRFMGPHAVRKLHADGHEVMVFHRGKSEPELPPDVRHLHCENAAFGDRSYFADFAADFRDFAPEVVLDMIPLTEADADALMTTFRDIAKRVVAISSVDVYGAYDRLRGVERGPADPNPLTEDAPLRQKLFPYRNEPSEETDPARSWSHNYDKILVERRVMNDPDLPGTVLRLPAVYGPDDYQRRLYPYIKRMDDGRPFILLEEGWAEWRWSRGYAQNMGEAIARAVEDDRASGRIYNVAEPESLTEAEWVSRIAQVIGWTGDIRILKKSDVELPEDQLPEALKQEGDTSHHLVVDTTRIRGELGYTESVPLDEAIRRTVEWDRANPPQNLPPNLLDYEAEDAAVAHVKGS